MIAPILASSRPMTPYMQREKKNRGRAGEASAAELEQLFSHAFASRLRLQMVYSFDKSANSNYTLCIQRIFGVDVLFSPDIPPSVHRRPVPRRRRQPRQARLALWPWSRGARRPSSPRPSRGMNVSREDSVRGQSKAGKGRPSHRSQGVRSQRNVHVRLEYNVVEVPARQGRRERTASRETLLTSTNPFILSSSNSTCSRPTSGSTDPMGATAVDVLCRRQPAETNGTSAAAPPGANNFAASMSIEVSTRNRHYYLTAAYKPFFTFCACDVRLATAVIRKVVLSGSARSEVVILVVFFDREPAPAQWSTCMFTLLLFELALKKDPREIRSRRQVQVRPTISQITASNYPTARKL